VSPQKSALLSNMAFFSTTAIFLQKSPAYPCKCHSNPQKSPTYPQKCPISPQKSIKDGIFQRYCYIFAQKPCISIIVLHKSAKVPCISDVFCGDAWLFCGGIGLLCRDTGLFCRDILIFCGYTGLFCKYMAEAHRVLWNLFLSALPACTQKILMCPQMTQRSQQKRHTYPTKRPTNPQKCPTNPQKCHTNLQKCLFSP